MNFNPTEQRLYDLLCDGELHRQKELTDCLYDSENEDAAHTLTVHLTHLRKKIAHLGRDVVARGINGERTYRMMRHLRRD